MSKSTPICELTSNSQDSCHNDTRPIVADILKEIELQNSSNEYLSEQQKTLDYQTDALTTGNDNHQINETENYLPEIESNNLEVNAEIPSNNSGLETIDNQNTIVNNDSDSVADFKNDPQLDASQDLDDVLTQKLPSIQEIPEIQDTLDTNNQQNSSFFSKQNLNYIYQNIRDPLLVFLVAMIVTMPQIQMAINNILSNIPVFNSKTGHVIFKSLVLAMTYYYLKKYI